MLLRFLFGDDIFISYAREDGATYAAGLANQLAKQKFSCRFDQWGTKAGKEIPKEMKRALRRSAMLVLIGTPAAARSDAVHQEVSIFKSTGRDMVPILFDGVGLGDGFIFINGRKVNSAQVDQSNATSVFKKTEDALWAEDIQGLPLSGEKTDLLITGDPSQAIVNRIEKTFQFSRKDERLRQTSKIVAAVVILLIGASVVAASIASMKSAEALTKAAEAAEQQRLAKQAKQEADKQTEAAGKAQEEAEKQRQQAVLNKQEADKQQKLAELNKAEAEKQGIVAEQRRREAETQTKISTSRRLASSAFAHLDDALNYSLSLSLDANKSAKTFEARSSLFAVLNHSPQLRSFLKDARKSERGDVAFSPNNKFLVSGGADGALRVWNLETAKLEAPPLTFVKEDYIMALGFSLTGDRLALVLSPKNQDKPEEVDKETAIIILDTKTWKAIGKPFKPGFVVTSVALNNTGEIMALGGMGGYITLWKLESATVKSLGELTDEPYGLAAVTSLVFSGDGNRLASLIVPALWPGETVIELAAKSNMVQLWNVPDKKLITKLPSTLEFSLNSIALSADGQLLAAGTTAGDVVVVDLTSTSKGNQLMRHKDQAVPSTSNAIISLAIGRDKNRIVSVTGGKTLVSWDRSTGTGSNATQLKASLDEFHEATFNLETEQLATFTDGGALILWEVLARPPLVKELPARLNELKSIAFDPHRSFVGAAANGQIFLWDLIGGKEIKTELPFFNEDIMAPLYSVVAVGFSKDGKKVASVSINGRVFIWDWDGSRLTNPGTLRTANFTQDALFNSDLTLMVSGSTMFDLTLTSLTEKKTLSTLPVRFNFGDQYFVHYTLSPNDYTLAAINGRGELELWNITDPKHPATIKIPETDDLTSLAFNADGSLLATGSRTGIINVWRMDSRAAEFSLRAPEQVHSLAFSPDNKMLASGTESGFIDLWDVEARQSLGQVRTRQTENVSLLVFSADNRMLGSGGKSGIQIWDVDLESWKKRAQKLLNGF